MCPPERSGSGFSHDAESRDLSAAISFDALTALSQALFNIFSAERPLDSALASLRAALGVT
jgi:hypothetical protein